MATAIESLQKSLQMFLRQPVRIVQRNDPLLISVASRLPATWRRALSAASVERAMNDIWWDDVSIHTVCREALSGVIGDLALVLTPSAGFLAYIFEGTTGLSAFLGGFPATNESIIKREAALGVRLPCSLKTFLEIHDGLLLDGWSSVGIRPLAGLFMLGDIAGNQLSAGSTANPYDPWKLLCFCGDGSGNEQCFDYSGPARGEPPTVCWDHETHRLGSPLDFDQFLLQFFLRETRT